MRQTTKAKNDINTDISLNISKNDLRNELQHFVKKTATVEIQFGFPPFFLFGLEKKIQVRKCLKSKY